jgi:hypothetical protein
MTQQSTKKKQLSLAAYLYLGDHHGYMEKNQVNSFDEACKVKSDITFF